MNAKTIYNTYCNQYVLDEEKLEHMKKVVLGILTDVVNVCEKYNIHYLLGGGTMLGAIRHNGFIPWDDDIDINMYRDDANLLIEKLEIEYPNKYFYVDPSTKGDDPTKSLKIMLIGTKEVEIEFVGLKEARGIGIDVFYIDNAPEDEKEINKRDKRYYFYSRASSVVYDYKHPSQVMLDISKQSKELKKYYRMRRLLGFLLSFRSIKKWTEKSEKVAMYGEKTSKVTIPSGIKGYKGELHDRALFDEWKYHKFENLECRIPKRYDEYLTTLYGDYMQIPPVEKREKHIIYELDFGKY